MTRYQPSRPTAAIGAAALAMTGLVFSLAVYVPATLAPTTTAVARQPAVEVAIIPSRIEVIGLRSGVTASNTATPSAVRAPNS